MNKTDLAELPEQRQKTIFEKTGIPRIAFGHMAAPCLMYHIEYAIFRRKDAALRQSRNRKHKFVTFFKGSF
jgi:hypothetical protein